MVEYVSIPKIKRDWYSILTSIPKGKAAKINFDKHYDAAVAGETARRYASRNKLGVLHTHISGATIDTTTGTYIDTNNGIALIVWF